MKLQTFNEFINESKQPYGMCNSFEEFKKIKSDINCDYVLLNDEGKISISFKAGNIPKPYSPFSGAGKNQIFSVWTLKDLDVNKKENWEK